LIHRPNAVTPGNVSSGGGGGSPRFWMKSQTATQKTATAIALRIFLGITT